MRALLISGAVMASTNILFSVLVWTGKVEWLFAVAVILDDLAAAFATVAFVTFISACGQELYGHTICAACIDRHIWPHITGVVIR